MIVLGIVLLILGLVFQSFVYANVLTTIGVILIIVGAVFWLLGRTGRPVGGRRYWY